MKKLLAAAVVTMLTAGTLMAGMLMTGTLMAGMLMTATGAAAEEARPISPAQLEKILKFVDTIGGKEELPPPTAQNLGVSGDPNQKLPVAVVVTDDHKVYFCRSELNPTDYIIWVRIADKDASYMFLTHADLKLVRSLYLRNQGFPQIMDVASAQIQAIYRDALVALAKDVDKAH